MKNRSSAYVSAASGSTKYTYHFTGVISVTHNLALNIDSDSAQGGDIINGARNLPDQVTLSVIETDEAHGSGYAKSMLEAMVSLKQNRYLCRVVTSLGTYKKMLLTEITATQDADNAFGWSGELVFMKYLPQSSSSGASSVRAVNNSSTRRNTGSAGGAATVSGTVFQQLLQRAGIT